MKKIYIDIINIINIIILFRYSGVLEKFDRIGLSQITSIVEMFVFVCLIACVYYFIIKVCLKKENILRENLSILIFIFLLGIFCIFVNYPKLYLKPWIKLSLTIIYGLYLVDRYSIKNLFHLLFIAQFYVSILTIFISLAFPNESIVMLNGQRVLQGTFYQKNSLGANMVYGFIVSFLIVISKNSPILKLKSIINLILCIVLIILSKSTTSIVALVSIITIYLLYKNNRVKCSLGWIFFSIHFIVYTVIINGQKFSEIFTLIFKKDITLTGRLEIWEAVIELIKERPLFGYGYGSFWNPNDAYLRNYLVYRTFGAAKGAHNGFLDWMLEIGIIGTILLILILLITMYKMKKIDVKKHTEIFLCYMFFTFLMIFYITERASRDDSYLFLVLIICIAITNKIAKRQRLGDNVESKKLYL